MRVTFAIATLLAILFASKIIHPTIAHAKDDLFSEISMAAVFESSTKLAEQTTSADARKPQRKINIQSLINPSSPPLPTVVKAKTDAVKTRAEVPKLTLVGTWSAAISSTEAFAIAITADRKFQLVHQKNGQSHVSVGTAAKSGNRLTLTGNDKTSIAGTVTQTDNQAFRLEVSPSLALNFKKAR
ncbi:hypothetical protein [Planctomycetes bacterium K23_9]|uniref:Uncharacterized protein n=1 Tax=Stieleria marina TaxID=1930275 RepID=A0A517NQC3_9BACT|nr:hypothetical protein K239x_12720 [Planctomycetes bacterium K23_9]